MLEHDFESSLGCWVGTTSRAFERAMNEELAPHGITSQQWQVLCWLAFEKDLTQSQLAVRMQVEAPTLVGILDRMEKAGWITREVSGTDRRKKLIRPMPKVQPVWETILAGARRVRARALAGIEPGELAVVRDVLARVRANLGEQTASANPEEASVPVCVESASESALDVPERDQTVGSPSRSSSSADRATVHT